MPKDEQDVRRSGERLTGALLNQLTYRVHIIETHGENCRLRDARKRRIGLKGA